MKISKNGIELIKCFESFSSKACKCLASEKYYTIGYGHYGADVKENQTITKEQAEDLLQKDLEKFEQKVNKYNNVYNFNQNQFDALVSFSVLFISFFVFFFVVFFFIISQTPHVWFCFVFCVL